MIYGYIRVSTEKQTVENQRYEIANFCETQKITVDRWFEETISGTKQYTERVLGNILKFVKAGDTLIATEISRLGRSLFMVMEILNVCLEKDCKVWTIRDGFRLGDDIQSKVLAFAFGLSAEIERNLISQRTREALARKKDEGAHLGRPVGSVACKSKLDGTEDRIVSMMRRGKSNCAIAKKLHCHRTTVCLFIERKDLKNIAEMHNVRPSLYFERTKNEG